MSALDKAIYELLNPTEEFTAQDLRRVKKVADKLRAYDAAQREALEAAREALQNIQKMAEEDTRGDDWGKSTWKIEADARFALAKLEAVK